MISPLCTWYVKVLKFVQHLLIYDIIIAWVKDLVFICVLWREAYE